MTSVTGLLVAVGTCFYLRMKEEEDEWEEEEEKKRQPKLRR
jgi:hypothetical protein